MNEGEIKGILQRQNKYFRTHQTMSYRKRMEALNRIEIALTRYEKRFYLALQKDLGKATYESYVNEIGLVRSCISYTKRHLKRWMKDKKVGSHIANFPSSSRIVYEPYGTVLIIAPWNYPVLLSLEPLVAAIAAGNTVVLKPSEQAPATATLLQQMLQEALQSELVATVLGGADVSSCLVAQKFDYIFFTGGVAIGKKIMAEAAKNLTPVTLELGGKSPVVVDRTANLKLAAKRIAFGKNVNCGQTCVAPDYLLIDEAVKDEFLRYYRQIVRNMYGENPIKNKNYGKIVNERHYQRLCGLIQDEKVVFGGRRDDESCKLEPTVMDGVKSSDPIMQEEIFGPILPVLTYKHIREAKAFIESRPKPLACYIFTNNKKVERLFVKYISYGSGCVNDVINQLVSVNMPFGGVGESGMGAYHGKYSFLTFSHEKSVLKKSQKIDVPLRYQPYYRIYDMLVRWILK